MYYFFPTEYFANAVGESGQIMKYLYQESQYLSDLNFWGGGEYKPILALKSWEIFPTPLHLSVFMCKRGILIVSTLWGFVRISKRYTY